MILPKHRGFETSLDACWPEGKALTTTSHGCAHCVELWAVALWAWTLWDSFKMSVDISWVFGKHKESRLVSSEAKKTCWVLWVQSLSKLVYYTPDLKLNVKALTNCVPPKDHRVFLNVTCPETECCEFKPFHTLFRNRLIWGRRSKLLTKRLYWWLQTHNRFVCI